MFVESMTFEEIRKEFEKEKDVILRKVFYEGKRIAKLMRKTNMHSYNKYFDFYSPRKNHWYYQFTTHNNSKAELAFMLYCYFYTQRGYCVIYYLSQNDRLNLYSSHFFTRYFQRENLDKENPMDIIRIFSEDNVVSVTQTLEKVSDGVCKLFAQMKHGVGLGYIHSRINLHEYRTFITNDMLKGTQIELSKQIEEKFNFHCLRNTPS